MDILKETEDLYTRQFSEIIRKADEILYHDDKLKDMYDNNFILVLNSTELRNIIKRELSNPVNYQEKFLKICTYFPIPKKINEEFKVMTDIYDFMTIPSARFDTIRFNNDCKVYEVTENMYEQCIEYDYNANKDDMGDFARKRILRKIDGYKKGKLKYFICLKDNKIIGSCELLINGDYAKMEDFSVLPQYRRQGYGSTILRTLIETAYKNNVKTSYVVTDTSDTAKEMYSKCGFTKVMEKYELFFDLK